MSYIKYTVRVFVCFVKEEVVMKITLFVIVAIIGPITMTIIYFLYAPTLFQKLCSTRFGDP